MSTATQHRSHTPTQHHQHIRTQPLHHTHIQHQHRTQTKHLHIMFMDTNEVMRHGIQDTTIATSLMEILLTTPTTLRLYQHQEHTATQLTDTLFVSRVPTDRNTKSATEGRALCIS